LATSVITLTASSAESVTVIRSRSIASMVRYLLQKRDSPIALQPEPGARRVAAGRKPTAGAALQADAARPWTLADPNATGQAKTVGEGLRSELTSGTINR
jgi:hypothetical protein